MAQPQTIDAALVRALVADQFPRWRGLPVEPVPAQGWDSRTFRLGDDLVVRLPSAQGYAASVALEDRILPLLASHLPLPVPTPVALGRPGPGYPFPWSVRSWLPGATLDAGPDLDRHVLASDLGRFLTALREAPAEGGPAGGRRSSYRGCHPSAYGQEVQQALMTLGGAVDVEACRRVWLRATTSAWPHPPVWVHGDVAAGNLLVEDGRLSAVLDFGQCCVGDPACDLVIAWTSLAVEERRAFRATVGLDDDTWRRARGWALWKALVVLTGDARPDVRAVQARALAEVLADPVAHPVDA